MVLRMELWNNGFPDGERLAVVDLPEEARLDEFAVKTAQEAASTTARQMLSKLGAGANLSVVFIPDAMTSEEMEAARREAGVNLPSTDQVLGSPDLH